MTLWCIYTIIFGPFSIVQEICERRVMEGNASSPMRDFKQRIEGAEIHTDITIFQI